MKLEQVAAVMEHTRHRPSNTFTKIESVRHQKLKPEAERRGEQNPLFKALTVLKVRFRAITGMDQADLRLAREIGAISGNEERHALAHLTDKDRFTGAPKTQD